MFDTPAFKRLAKNDTTTAPGHQGGIVIPKDIAGAFPPIEATPTDDQPTVDVWLTAELMRGGLIVDIVKTRYQHQTWGGKRNPERRLTGNLGPIRNCAPGDFVLFYKDLTDDRRIRIELVRAGESGFARLERAANGHKWGYVDVLNPPVTLSDRSLAKTYLDEISAGPVVIYDRDRRVHEQRATRLARDRAFREKVLSIYGNRCAFTRSAISTPAGLVGLDAAHIVDVKRGGSDHPANGLALSKDLHWAFDNWLIFVTENRELAVPEKVAVKESNTVLRDMIGRPLAEPEVSGLRASDEALAVHRQLCLENWA